MQQPGAVLVPTDLIGRIVELVEDEAREAVSAALEASSFVGSAGSMFLWVVSNCGAKQDAIVASALSTTGRTTLDPEQWIGAADFPRAIEVPDGDIAVDERGVEWYLPHGKRPRKQIWKLAPSVSVQHLV